MVTHHARSVEPRVAHADRVWEANTRLLDAAEPGRHFAFLRGGRGATSWHYHLTPAGTGTELTEPYLVEQPVSAATTWLTLWMRGTKDFQADMRANLETTLARIKATAERGARPT